MENKIITEEEMISELLTHIPSFSPMFQKKCEYWGGVSHFPIGLQMEEFTEFIYQELRNNNSNKKLLRESFDMIETLLIQGDEKVRNYVYFMFVESLINLLDNNGYDYKKIELYLGLRTKKTFERVNDFWMKGKTIDSLDSN